MAACQSTTVGSAHLVSADAGAFIGIPFIDVSRLRAAVYLTRDGEMPLGSALGGKRTLMHSLQPADQEVEDRRMERPHELYPGNIHVHPAYPALEDF